MSDYTYTLTADERALVLDLLRGFRASTMTREPQAVKVRAEQVRHSLLAKMQEPR